MDCFSGLEHLLRIFWILGLDGISWGRLDCLIWAMASGFSSFLVLEVF